MDLTLSSLWEWTKLTVRAPATASALVKAAKLPLEVSIMMIVLAGVVSGVTSGFLNYIMDPPPFVFSLGDGRAVTYELGGPFSFGITSVCLGLALAFSVSKIGTWMGGQGTLADIMSVTAVLQLALTVIYVIEAFARLAVPILAFGISLFGIYVAVRGLGHAVKVAHDFKNMGRSAGVIAMASFVSLIGVAIMLNLLGLTPEGVIGPVPEGAL